MICPEVYCCAVYNQVTSLNLKLDIQNMIHPEQKQEDLYYF